MLLTQKSFWLSEDKHLKETVILYSMHVCRSADYFDSKLESCISYVDLLFFLLIRCFYVGMQISLDYWWTLHNLDPVSSTFYLVNFVSS